MLTVLFEYIYFPRYTYVATRATCKLYLLLSWHYTCMTLSATYYMFIILLHAGTISRSLYETDLKIYRSKTRLLHVHVHVFYVFPQVGEPQLALMEDAR